MSKAWILVTDAARARLFETAERNDRLVEVACYANPDPRGEPTDHVRRRIPRAHESTTPSNHAIDPHARRHDKSLHQFAHSLTMALKSGHSHHHYERLVLIAPPRLLGALRENLGDPLAKELLVGEIDNDLIDLHPDELLDHLHATYPREFCAIRARPSTKEGGAMRNPESRVWLKPKPIA